MEVQDDIPSIPQSEVSASEPFILRDLISDIPLSADDSATANDVYVTCADVWDGNLYIGTSAGELLHYVSLPTQSSDESTGHNHILASRTRPTFNSEQDGAEKGIKQILILPHAGKACILCNGTLSFYTLPELSPAFGGKIKQSGCTWVGGLDSNEDSSNDQAGGTIIVICLRQRLRLIRIGEDARKIRDIELGGVQAIQRRGDLACVAAPTSYSLLDVVNQQKVDLFPISSSASTVTKSDALLPGLPTGRTQSRSFSSASPERVGRSHARIVSLGNLPQRNSFARTESTSPWPARSSSTQQQRSSGSESRQVYLNSQDASGEPHSVENPEVAHLPGQKSQASEEKTLGQLLPNIVTPTSTEFLLTTGTKYNEPGVGMFVNLEGDLVPRGTLEFSSYPRSIVLQGAGQHDASGFSASPAQPGYILAVVQKEADNGVILAMEIQKWDVDHSEAHDRKFFIQLLDSDKFASCDYMNVAGLRNTSSPCQLVVPEIRTSLRLRRLVHHLTKAIQSQGDMSRDAEEDRFAARFATISANILVYTKDTIQWVARNPLIVQLERQLRQTISRSATINTNIDVPGVHRVLNSIRGMEPQDELEFLTLTYIRQKASLLMFGDLIAQTIRGVMVFERNKRITEEALVQGEVDPRAVLVLVPPLTEEIREGDQGVWIPQGLRDTVDLLRSLFGNFVMSQDPKGAYGDNLLKVLKRYLLVWRKKKGFGSITDEAHVFQTVDAALLRVLLLLDQESARGPAIPGSIRGELNDVVDKGVDCYDRAVELFEQHHRLYMLSRLYQFKKNTSMVLATWKRILQGERDDGGELVDGEMDMRKYLSKLKDAKLVREYGSWLANRNSKIGVQVFADDTAKVHFLPSDAVAILKDSAPDAVKDYLEYLVFGKNHVQYVNELIAFYLDTVLAELDRSDEAKRILIHSYETYRALKPPKPTYSQFITDNGLDTEWAKNRLRLLQLIGGSHGAASEYNVHALRERLAGYSEELVPEMIILNGREEMHEEALRLLTRNLGDYDTSIRYCLLGGSSIFHVGSHISIRQNLPTKEQQSRLFSRLLHEFLQIEDISDRLERTSELLERFGGWFDVSDVLNIIPESWSVELVSGFLVHAFRRIVAERNETDVLKALRSAQNLRQSIASAEHTESMKPRLVTAEHTSSDVR